MPIAGQIIPEYQYPHTKVYINDNSERVEEASTQSGKTRLLCVFMSPKGEDSRIKTINNGLNQFLSEYGFGPSSIFGQPYLNAYAAAATGETTLHCLRVTASDATYANVHVFAEYLVDSTTDPTNPSMTVRFKTKSTLDLTDLKNLESSVEVSDAQTDDGYSEAYLFSIASLGRGKYGMSYRPRLSAYTRGDRTNNYKNYTFELYEDSVVLENEIYTVSFYEDAIVSGNSLFIDNVINDTERGSGKIMIHTNIAGFETLMNAYRSIFPETTLSLADFDFLLGIDKYTKDAIVGYAIDTTAEGAISVNALTGIPLQSGSDGSFDISTSSTVRNAEIEARYLAAFTGVIDERIKSRNMFPLDAMFDAAYSMNVKKSMVALNTIRGDCICFLDGGTEFTSKAQVLEVGDDLDIFANNRLVSADVYYGKIKDPYNQKIVTVTSTYALCQLYPLNYAEYNGKYVPLAGGTYGLMDIYLKDTIFPIFDEDLDSALMNQLIEYRLNYVQVNARGNVIRGTQTTRQERETDLSEINNMSIVLDIKKDVEALMSDYAYNLNDASNLARFNRDISFLLPKYANAQVKSITGRFDSNEWETERAILHLYIEMQCKDLVKIGIVEIDVNP